MELIQRNAVGEAVRDVQQRLMRLGLIIDGAEGGEIFGASTQEALRAFQRTRHLPADGIVGPDTWGQLVEAGWELGDRPLYLHEPFFRGDDVRTLQQKLNSLGFDAWREDGIFGQQVDRAVRRFQRNVGLEPDGIVGTETTGELDRMRPDLALPSRAAVREAAAIGDRSTLAEALIAVDPGHGPADPGAIGPTGLTEHEAVYVVAERLCDVLRASGARAILLRMPTETPTPSERAARANEAEADLCISLHCNDGDPAAEGVTCLYFGSGVSASPLGQRLADVVQSAVIASMALRDCRVHPMSLAILRETSMPAAQIELCFITNRREEDLLRDDEAVTMMATAIAEGVRTFLTGS